MDTSRMAAEAELLALIRLEGAQNFTLIIGTDGSQWTVTTHDHDSNVRAFGRGNSFGDAWFNRTGADPGNPSV